MYQQITKRQAQKLFAEGKMIYLVPRKMSPNGVWDAAYPTTSEGWLDHVTVLRGVDSPVVTGKPDLEAAWDLMYNNWAFYNTSYETGYYAHYYIQKD